MATAATTLHMTAYLEALGITLPTIDSSAASDSYAYEFIQTSYEMMIIGLNNIITLDDAAVSNNGNIVCL